MFPKSTAIRDVMDVADDVEPAQEEGDCRGGEGLIVAHYRVQGC